MRPTFSTTRVIIPCTLAPTHTRDDPDAPSVRRLRSTRFLVALTPTIIADTRSPTVKRELSFMASSDDLSDVSIFGMKDVIPGAIVTLIPSSVTETTYALTSSPTETSSSTNADFLCIDRSRSPPRSPARPITVASTVEPTEIDSSGVSSPGLNSLM